MARKTWSDLSEAYRARLIRQGITPQQHASGVSLHKARGKKSAEHERDYRRELRQRHEREVGDWVRNFARLYSVDIDDIREELNELPKDDVWRAVRFQARMQDLYHEGHISEARALWEHRDRSMPDWMHYYHGYFS